MNAEQKETFELWMQDGRLELAHKNGWAAEYAFTNALKLDPENKEAREGLSEARELLGKKPSYKKREKNQRIRGLDKYLGE